jgi:hypothetical protein
MKSAIFDRRREVAARLGLEGIRLRQPGAGGARADAQPQLGRDRERDRRRVVYLASARASYIRGTIVTIDAGQSLRPRV